jgi:toxin-antitoxin system PIN domain toxin
LILVDANLLVYAHSKRAPNHGRARDWLDAQLSGRRRVGLPWESVLAFVRLISNPRVHPHPQPIADAWAQVGDWLSAPPAWIPLPTDRHLDVLTDLVPAVGRSELLPDAHLAALAIEHGLVLASADRDFARFDNLRWMNPLAG